MKEQTRKSHALRQMKDTAENEKPYNEYEHVLKHPEGHAIYMLHAYADGMKVDKEELERVEQLPISTLRVVQLLLAKFGEVSSEKAAGILIDDARATRKLDYECDNHFGSHVHHAWWSTEYVTKEEATAHRVNTAE